MQTEGKLSVRFLKTSSDFASTACSITFTLYAIVIGYNYRHYSKLKCGTLKEKKSFVTERSIIKRASFSCKCRFLDATKERQVQHLALM